MSRDLTSSKKNMMIIICTILCMILFGFAVYKFLYISSSKGGDKDGVSKQPVTTFKRSRSKRKSTTSHNNKQITGDDTTSKDIENEIKTLNDLNRLEFSNDPSNTLKTEYFDVLKLLITDMTSTFQNEISGTKKLSNRIYSIVANLISFFRPGKNDELTSGEKKTKKFLDNVSNLSMWENISHKLNGRIRYIFHTTKVINVVTKYLKSSEDEKILLKLKIHDKNISLHLMSKVFDVFELLIGNVVNNGDVFNLRTKMYYEALNSNVIPQYSYLKDAELPNSSNINIGGVKLTNCYEVFSYAIAGLITAFDTDDFDYKSPHLEKICELIFCNHKEKINMDNQADKKNSNKLGKKELKKLSKEGLNKLVKKFSMAIRNMAKKLVDLYANEDIENSKVLINFLRGFLCESKLKETYDAISPVSNNGLVKDGYLSSYMGLFFRYISFSDEVINRLFSLLHIRNEMYLKKEELMKESSGEDPIHLNVSLTEKVKVKPSINEIVFTAFSGVINSILYHYEHDNLEYLDHNLKDKIDYLKKIENLSLDSNKSAEELLVNKAYVDYVKDKETHQK